YVTAADAGMKPIAAYHFDVVANADAWAEVPTIRLHAGAMLVPGLNKVIEAFKAREGVEIHTVPDGCGLLIDNMKILAKQQSKLFPDGFVSCDVSFTEKVADFFESATAAQRAYDEILQNDLVLIVPKANPKGIEMLDDLRDRARLKDLKIGLPDPKH